MDNQGYEYRWQKGTSRYYKICVYKDMLNDWILTSAWGGINSNLGNYKHVALNSIEEAATLIENMMKRRLRRGYTLMFSSGAL